ncbi:1-(5-phosphoribosyl)-5-[(5-phosphoribosylamino)methylideneamino]imidazole-4-carboxamide isomerase [Ktedonosporobacter rubrisoli]|uniref:1-(5-phosphoribosyl)-5-[(5-phosphoribosylamino)methylideneamino] imidazole-4-carboxamide isomerase n=1 Tax=Ktedonosporobacter rubrisoli TaxID=2509675 RepID=A0A4P6K686_KTERU|nr:1-(5-phosphoribosyl)-5-[(5-phosphoribosylamino)methylideneamino]imidazole-4-carboxamide isomerase [Ktedonosporobacter rubrisoli]
MIILPAIDIKDGLCVRLYQGDYAKVTTYGTDPVQVALRWQEAGASWLHVVDLDGAAKGQPVNTALIERICAATNLRVEVGGGMRSLAHIEQVLATGAERVILGTVALTDRALLQEALSRWQERLVVGLDARNGLVAIAGWHETSQVQATELAAELETVGVQRFVYTDIARDGALSGPNLKALKELQAATSRQLIASGGVSSLADLQALAELDVEGAIVGKAIYTGDVELARAIQELERC